MQQQHRSLDIEDSHTETEMATFVNVTRTQHTGSDVTVQYRLSADVRASGQDWVGIFRSESEPVTSAQPLAFQWAPVKSSNKRRQELVKSVTFRADIFAALQHPTDTFYYAYVSKAGTTLGKSSPFHVSCTAASAEISGDKKKKKKKSNKNAPTISTSASNATTDGSTTPSTETASSPSIVVVSSDDDDWDFGSKTSLKEDHSCLSDMSDIVVLSTSPSKEAAAMQHVTTSSSLLEDSTSSSSEGFVVTRDIKRDVIVLPEEVVSDKEDLDAGILSNTESEYSCASQKSKSKKKKKKGKKAKNLSDEHDVECPEKKDDSSSPATISPEKEREQENHVVVLSSPVLSVSGRKSVIDQMKCIYQDEESEPESNGLVQETKVDNKKKKKGKKNKCLIEEIPDEVSSEVQVAPIICIDSDSDDTPRNRSKQRKAKKMKRSKNGEHLAFADPKIGDDKMLSQDNSDIVSTPPVTVNQSPPPSKFKMSFALKPNEVKKGRSSKVEAMKESDNMKTGDAKHSKANIITKKDSSTSKTQEQSADISTATNRQSKKKLKTEKENEEETIKCVESAPAPEERSRTRKKKKEKKNADETDMSTHHQGDESSNKDSLRKIRKKSKDTKNLENLLESNKSRKSKKDALDSSKIVDIQEPVAPSSRESITHKTPVNKQSKKKGSKVSEIVASFEETVVETSNEHKSTPMVESSKEQRRGMNKDGPARRDAAKKPFALPGEEMRAIREKYVHKPSAVNKKRERSRAHRKPTMTYSLAPLFGDVIGDEEAPINAVKASTEAPTEDTASIPHVVDTSMLQNISEDDFPSLPTTKGFTHLPTVDCDFPSLPKKNGCISLLPVKDGETSRVSTANVPASPPSRTWKTPSTKSWNVFLNPALCVSSTQGSTSDSTAKISSNDGRDTVDGSDAAMPELVLASRDLPALPKDVVDIMEDLPPASSLADGRSLVEWQRALVPMLAKGALPYFKAKYKAKSVAKRELRRHKMKKVPLTPSILYKLMHGVVAPESLGLCKSKKELTDTTVACPKSPITVPSGALSNAPSNAPSNAHVLDEHQELCEPEGCYACALRRCVKFEEPICSDDGLSEDQPTTPSEFGAKDGTEDAKHTGTWFGTKEDVETTEPVSSQEETAEECNSDEETLKRLSNRLKKKAKKLTKDKQNARRKKLLAKARDVKACLPYADVSSGCRGQGVIEIYDVSAESEHALRKIEFNDDSHLSWPIPSFLDSLKKKVDKAKRSSYLDLLRDGDLFGPESFSKSVDATPKVTFKVKGVTCSNLNIEMAGSSRQQESLDSLESGEQSSIWGIQLPKVLVETVDSVENLKHDTLVPASTLKVTSPPRASKCKSSEVKARASRSRTKYADKCSIREEAEMSSLSTTIKQQQRTMASLETKLNTLQIALNEETKRRFKLESKNLRLKQRLKDSKSAYQSLTCAVAQMRSDVRPMPDHVDEIVPVRQDGDDWEEPPRKKRRVSHTLQSDQVTHSRKATEKPVSSRDKDSTAGAPKKMTSEPELSPFRELHDISERAELQSPVLSYHCVSRVNHGVNTSGVDSHACAAATSGAGHVVESGCKKGQFTCKKTSGSSYSVTSTSGSDRERHPSSRHAESSQHPAPQAQDTFEHLPISGHASRLMIHRGGAWRRSTSPHLPLPTPVTPVRLGSRQPSPSASGFVNRQPSPSTRLGYRHPSPTHLPLHTPESPPQQQPREESRTPQWYPFFNPIDKPSRQYNNARDQPSSEYNPRVHAFSQYNPAASCRPSWRTQVIGKPHTVVSENETTNDVFAPNDRHVTSTHVINQSTNKPGTSTNTVIYVPKKEAPSVVTDAPARMRKGSIYDAWSQNNTEKRSCARPSQTDGQVSSHRGVNRDKDSHVTPSYGHINTGEDTTTNNKPQVFPYGEVREMSCPALNVYSTDLNDFQAMDVRNSLRFQTESQPCNREDSFFAPSIPYGEYVPTSGLASSPRPINNQSYVSGSHEFQSSGFSSDFETQWHRSPANMHDAASTFSKYEQDHFSDMNGSHMSLPSRPVLSKSMLDAPNAGSANRYQHVAPNNHTNTCSHHGVPNNHTNTCSHHVTPNNHTNTCSHSSCCHAPDQEFPACYCCGKSYSPFVNSRLIKDQIAYHQRHR